MKTISDFYTSLKAHPRYPNTFAYDYIRQLLPENLSRGEAAQVITKICEHWGLDRNVTIESLANQYCHHRAAEMLIEHHQKGEAEHWQHLWEKANGKA